MEQLDTASPIINTFGARTIQPSQRLFAIPGVIETSNIQRGNCQFWKGHIALTVFPEVRRESSSTVDEFKLFKHEENSPPINKNIYSLKIIKKITNENIVDTKFFPDKDVDELVSPQIQTVAFTADQVTYLTSAVDSNGNTCSAFEFKSAEGHSATVIMSEAEVVATLEAKQNVPSINNIMRALSGFNKATNAVIRPDFLDAFKQGQDDAEQVAKLVRQRIQRDKEIATALNGQSLGM